MLIGTHCSIAGGMENAIAQAEQLGIDTFQVFTKNQRQWREREFTEEEGNPSTNIYKFLITVVIEANLQFANRESRI